MRAFITAPILLAIACPSSPGQNRTRIGTYDSRALVIAYYRSDGWAKQLNAKIAERDQARAAGDAQKVAEMEKWGKEHQEFTHRQLAGEAPLTNILDELKPAMAAVAVASRVEAIVPELLYSSPNVEAVDVTDALIAYFSPDQKTIKIIHDLPHTVMPAQSPK